MTASLRTFLLLPCLIAFALPAAAQEYLMPWERAEAAKPKVDPDKVEAVEIESGKMEILRLPPVAGLKDATVLSTHPEVAELHVEAPNLLFVFGHQPGVTSVVIADENKEAVWSAAVTVRPPGYFEE